MKLRNAVHRSVVIITILVLSVTIGYIYSSVLERIDIKKHPREYREQVEQYSAAYGVPEDILYAVILTGSDFESNHVSEDGRIGLTQLSASTFERLTRMTKEELSSGMLYDPDTNIRYGAYWLSYLYTEYGRWRNVLAAYVADDRELVDLWLENEEYVDDRGSLAVIPSATISSTVEEIERAVDSYHELYFDTAS